MKIALVTTAPGVRSGIGDYTRHLLPYLRELADVDVFVEPGTEQSGPDACLPADQLVPSQFDQVLYQLGNERSHSFMPRMIRAVGGTVMQHDWVLFDLALATWPGLVRGGLKGHMLAAREGGLGQMRTYSKNWADRREQRNRPYLPPAAEELDGQVLAGWHFPEERGRWTGDMASVRIPAKGVREVTVQFAPQPGRSMRLLAGDRVSSDVVDGKRLVIEPSSSDEPVVLLHTEGIRVTAEQRAHGDSRRLGSFVESIKWADASGTHELDLSEEAAEPLRSITLSRDRFLLPFNRSIVRFADAFIVHSRYVGELIQSDRNANTAIGVVHHGSEYRWREEPRIQTRASRGLSEAWQEGFLVTSFGGVQKHKRIDKALEALALARKERQDIRMVLAGSMNADDFNPRDYARRLGLEDAVRFTGFVEEEEGWDWLHAGDVALNLRGPTSGGTSGGIFQAFSIGRPVIASNAAEQRELPESCVLKVPLGDGEVESLARTFVELRDDPARRQALEEATRRFVNEECHWGIVAKRYVEHMQGFPKPSASRRQLVAMRVALTR